MKNILVTDGENRSALAVTRSLGRKGCRVVVTGQNARNLASCSKFCMKRFVTPDPLREGMDYVMVINEITEKENIDFIFPMTEQSIHLLNSVRGSLPERTVLACPVSEKMQVVADKSALCHLAERLQVLIPDTFYLTGPGELSAIVGKIDRYPVVVKPALSMTPEGQGFIAAGVRYADSREELEQLYQTSSALRYPSIIQEKIIGLGTGLFTLYDVDHHVALFSHRRLREKPPTGGVSVVSESVPLDKDMVEAADRLLSAVGWSGVAMVEFKRDQRDGKAKLMEINGRFWGSLQLAIACGVDFPSLLLDYLQGENRSGLVRNYREGHKLKWFFGTLDHLLIRLKSGGKYQNIPSVSPTRLQAVGDFLNIWEEDTTFDVFDRNDQKPFWFEGGAYIRNAFKLKGCP